MLSAGVKNKAVRILVLAAAMSLLAFACGSDGSQQTVVPASAPTGTDAETVAPTGTDTEPAPTDAETVAPTGTDTEPAPTDAETVAPTGTDTEPAPTDAETVAPTGTDTEPAPTDAETVAPTGTDTEPAPTDAETVAPTGTDTEPAPTDAETVAPTGTDTEPAPTDAETVAPTGTDTEPETESPTSTSVPTETDTAASAGAASIEITPIGRGVSVTSEDQILVELEAADVVPANPFDLAGRTLVFAPDGRGGYSRAVRPLDWDSEDRGERPGRPVEIELKHFEFDYSGREWRSFFLSRTGLITFGEAFSEERTPARFGTMEMIAEAMVMAPTISALYKPYLGGNVYVSDLADRVVITYYALDYEMAVYGRRPNETFNHQVVLHSDGRVAFNYGPDPADADEAFRDGVVGLFQTDPTTGEAPRIADRVADLSQPDSGFSAAQAEVFRYPAIRDRGEGVADVSCRIVEVLGDEFDFFAFNSQSRADQQEHGPAHGFGGWYPGNQTATGLGLEPEPHRVTPCDSRLTNSWGFPVWMKAATVVNEGYASDGYRNPYDEGLTYFAHEIAHTWLAYASYLANGERTPMQTDPTGGSHWAFALHAPAPFPWDGTENGSVMGGAFWRDNPDGTFSPTVGWWTKAGGFSWLDLYLMGLATPEEVPDMFMLRDLQQLTSDRSGPYAGEMEIVTMDQIIAAIGPRKPPPERARKVFNVGFVYFLLPGETPDPGLLREHANYRDRALDHWHYLTGGRGQLTTELP